MELREKLKILALSSKEEKILLAVIDGLQTPVLISRHTKITRPAVYELLKKLKKRGIVHTRINGGKRFWELVRQEDMDTALYEAKKVLLSISEGTEEVKGLSDGTVIVHRGREAVEALITALPKGHKREWFFALQGVAVQKGWEDVVGQKKINEFNENVQRNEIITKLVVPYDWFENQVQRLGTSAGISWLKGFTGRANSAVRIDSEYCDHAGQIFIFKNSLYLMSINEGLVIEIRNSELQKLIKQMFSFVEDHGDKFNMNDEAEKLIKTLKESAERSLIQ
jgi:DNA-binding transcriptional ArsR family regulator